MEQVVDPPTVVAATRQDRGRAAVSWFTHRLFRLEDAASLGALRVMFGVLMLWEISRFFLHAWIYRYYIEPTFHFTYLGFEWVRPLPPAGMYAFFSGMMVLAGLIALGLFFRAAIVLFTVGFAYIFLLEQARYLNHFYLIILVGLLFCVTDGNRWLALDQKLFRKGKPELVPFWQIFLLRAQLFIVYFYAGIAKLNPDWLQGEPVRMWLAERSRFPVLGPLLAGEWAVWVVAYGGLLFDLGIGFLLISRRTRILGLVLAFLFHATNNYLFQIGVFPYLALGYTLLFLDPDWPRRFLFDLGLGSKPKPVAGQGGPSSVQRSVVVALTAYLALQLLVPLRHWLYPGDVNWTEEGHRFSWRMKLRNKDSHLTLRVRDPRTGEERLVEALRYVRPWQLSAAMDRPDMVLQLAHHVRDRMRTDRGMPSPEVYASVLCSLNGAPAQELIDPTVNLAAEKRGLHGVRWILPRRSGAGRRLSPRPRPSAEGGSE